MIDKIIFGYSTNNHLILDLDNTTLEKSIGLSKLLINEFDLRDCLILKSSGCIKTHELMFGDDESYMPYQTDGNYHLVFGKKTWYEHICYIIEMLADLGIVQKEYVRIREWRGDLTLRINADNSKDKYRPPPKLLFYVTNSKNTNSFSEGINDYLHFYTLFNGMYNVMFMKIICIKKKSNQTNSH